MCMIDKLLGSCRVQLWAALPVYASTASSFPMIPYITDFKHIEAETKWTPTRIRHFQTGFLE